MGWEEVVETTPMAWDELDVEGAAAVSEGFCPRCRKQTLESVTNLEAIYLREPSRAYGCWGCTYLYALTDEVPPATALEISFRDWFAGA